MESERPLYLGLLMVAVGATLAGVQLLGALLGRSAWPLLWPLLVLDVALAFWLPLVVWRGRRSLAGLAVPGIVLALNGLILLYQSLTGQWRTWAYLWALEPIALGAAFLYMAGAGVGGQGLRSVGLWFMGVGGLLLLLAISLYGGWLAYIGPMLLIAVGLLLLLRGRLERSRQQ
ncbi:MAG: hypothetical protein GXX94_06245 [Chloroflexi bacterium]|nr:hypothetical protein [Chloroflexota bacterium]